jgi:hypothetical protein
MSSDDDGIGIVFRFNDSANYYQFHWDAQRSLCRLEKMIGGASSVVVLDAALTGYTMNVWYHLDLTCMDSIISLSISGGNLASPVQLQATDATFNRGAAGLYSWGCQNANFDNIMVTTAEKDTIPPGAITDLSASTSWGNGKIEISWTSPGDDSMTGTASKYQVKYSTSPINDLNQFLAAESLVSPPLPNTASSQQVVTVYGLVPGQTYYFRIRTRDEFFNWSALSNQETRPRRQRLTIQVRRTGTRGSCIAIQHRVTVKGLLTKLSQCIKLLVMIFWLSLITIELPRPSSIISPHF